MLHHEVILLIGFIIPIIVFSYLGLIKLPHSLSKEEKHPNKDESDEILLAGRTASQNDFNDSSLAYMLQVSTTFYFVYWGYNYGFSNVFYLIVWGIGLYIFSNFAHRLNFVRDKYETIPALLSQNKSNFIRNVAAIVTMVGFVGMVYVEAFFSSEFIAAIVIPKSPEGMIIGSPIWWLFFVILTTSCIVYSCFGGLRKVFYTDKYQLAAAYLGVGIVISYCVWASGGVQSSSSITISILFLFLYITLLIADFRYRNYTFKTTSVLLSILMLTLAILYPSDNPTQTESIPGLFKQLGEPWGWVTLVGFSVLNILWQFCDESNFQRISALNFNRHLDDSEKTKIIKKSIRRLVIISPLTWGLGILVGMSIKVLGVFTGSGQTELAAFTFWLQDRVLAGDLFALFALLGLGTAFSSIMMSTSDSSIVAALQVFSRDIKKSGSVNQMGAILFGLTICPVLLVAAYVHTSSNITSIFVIMATVYSQLIVLALPVIFSLFGQSVSFLENILAMVFGSFCLWFATFNTFGLHPNIILVLPILFGTAGAILPLTPRLIMTVLNRIKPAKVSQDPL